MARQPNTATRGGGLDENSIEAVWQKGKPEPEYAGFRKDACDATMQRTKYGKTEQWGWQIDPIKPVAKGGTDDLSNLRPLQWENNRSKADDYLNYNCKVRSWREPNPPSAPPLPGPFLS